MIFGKKRRHKLPTFPANAKGIFKRLCETLPVEEMPKLKEELDACLNDFYLKAQKNRNIRVELADEIAKRCYHLIERYHEFSPKSQALIVGALRYFAIADDPLSEEIFVSGFLDDIQVVNHVLEELEIEGMFIKLD